jgi:hypothetical protein
MGQPAGSWMLCLRGSGALIWRCLACCFSILWLLESGVSQGHAKHLANMDHLIQNLACLIVTF